MTNEERKVIELALEALEYINDSHVSDLHKFARAIEAVHGIKGKA